MGNIIFIVWRESLEAVLIIGILHSFLTRKSDTRSSVRYMWSGVACGIVLSALLALTTIKIQNELTGRALEYFQTSILFVSAILMTQMVVWMNKHGRLMKKELETNLSQAMSKSGLLGIALVAALSIAREGTETVVYLYSLTLENSASGPVLLTLAACGGLTLALSTAWIVSKGIKFLNYAMFFKVTSYALLFSAAGLIVTGTSRLIEIDVLPTLVDPLWNTSWMLDGASRFGGIIATFTGYRSRPSLMIVLVYIAYWFLAFAWMKRDQWFPAPAKLNQAQSLQT